MALIGTIIHDTRVILDADFAAQELFRADPGQLLGYSLVALVDDADLRGLARLRLRLLRETPDRVPQEVDYRLRRFDDSAFFGRVTTTRLPDGRWQSIIEYLYDYRY